MKKILLLLTTALAVFCITFSSCSSVEDAEYDEEEKSATEAFTDKVAHEAVDAIRSPINKARTVQQKAEDRVEGIDNIEE